MLVVDDEVNVSRSLVRLLRQDDYKIFTASSGKEGLDILKDNEINVIISDQRMPEMSGTEFLSEASKIYPNTIRIVLSGYTELQSVTEAINEGSIFKFLTKPWDDNALREIIKDAFRQYDIQMENRRLNDELKKANEKLKEVNSLLNQELVDETRQTYINHQSLLVAQDILHNMPIGIIGADEDGMIVFANNKAHEIFSSLGGFLIGNEISQVVPEVDRFSDDSAVYIENTKLQREAIPTHVNLKLFRHKILNDTSAVFALIMPIEGDLDE